MATAVAWESDPLERILVAVDFSETASLALDRALDLAAGHGSELILVHVMQPDLPVVAAPEMLVIPPDYEALLRNASSEGLSKAASRVRSAGVRVREVLEQGRPAARICAVALAMDADLILIGTRGHTGFQGLMLGSVAKEVVRSARPPVITVHPADDRPIEPVAKLMLPTDFSEAAEQALGAATRLLAGSTEATILLVHTFQIAPSVVPLSGFGKGFAPKFVEDAAELARRTARPVAKSLRSRGFEVEVLIERGDPSEVVTRLAAEHEVDLIAMGTRGHGKLRQLLLGSTAERVVEHAPCPVMTVHAQGEGDAEGG